MDIREECADTVKLNNLLKCKSFFILNQRSLKLLAELNHNIQKVNLFNKWEQMWVLLFVKYITLF